MSLKTNHYKKIVSAIILYVLLGNLQAGWLDKNLDKIKKAKELISKTKKPEETKNDDDNQKAVKKSTEEPVTNVVKQSKKEPDKIAYNKSNSQLSTLYFELSKSGRLRTLELSAYRGALIRDFMSQKTLNEIKKESGKHASQLKIKTAKFAKYRYNSYQLYKYLQVVKKTYGSLNKEKLKKVFSKYPENVSQDQYVAIMQWKLLAGYLAINALSDESYAKYFCSETPCLVHDRRSSNRYSALNWGGLLNKNEFKKRRLQSDFVDIEFSKLVEWSKNHTFLNEEYLVGNMRFPNYNFQKGLFDLKFRFEQSILGKDKVTNNYVEMNDKEAEALVKQHKNETLYYLYKVNSSISDNSYLTKSKVHQFSEVKYDFKLASNVIEIFWGRDLSDKWVDIPIRVKNMNRGADANSVLKGADGLTKARECKNYFRKNRLNGTTVADYSATCTRACSLVDGKLRKSQLPTQEEIDLCNTNYDEFKSALSFKAKTAPESGVNTDKRKKFLAEVVGQLMMRGRNWTLETRSADFSECGPRFKMDSANGAKKLKTFKRYSKVKLIGIHWTVDNLGRKNSKCLASDIEFLSRQ